MFNRFYSLSSIHSPKFAAICFALVLLLLAQPVAACDLHYKIHVQCENGHQERLYSLEELSEFSLPEECEATPQIVQDFTMALATIMPRVAETQTQWVNLNIMIGDNVVVPVYGLDDCILRETKKVGDVVVIYDQAHSLFWFSVKWTLGLKKERVLIVEEPPLFPANIAGVAGEPKPISAVVL